MKALVLLHILCPSYICNLIMLFDISLVKNLTDVLTLTVYNVLLYCEGKHSYSLSRKYRLLLLSIVCSLEIRKLFNV